MTSGEITIVSADPKGKDAKWCFGQYYSELDERLDTGFDPKRTRAVSTRELEPPAGLLLIAYSNGSPVGCGAVKFHEDRVAEIKRLWVSKKLRGTGLGRRLLSSLEAEASKAGMDSVHLDTNKVLREAIALYRSSGYVEVAPFNDEKYANHWFEKRL